jgi:HK97 family phage portal protein
MNFISRMFRRTPEKRTPSTWDLLRTGGDWGLTDSGIPVSPHLAENLSVVFACTQIISETVGMLPLYVYRKTGDARLEDTPHPVARVFATDANEWQTASEFIELMTAHCLLRGNAYSEIRRDGRGQPVELVPYHPDLVSVVRIGSTDRFRYDVSMPQGGTRRILPEDMLHLKDRSDDGIIGKSRLARARETFGTALAVERYAGSTFRNGAAMSGVLSHPEALGDEASERLRKSFESTYSGAGNAGRVAVLEEGLKWQQVSVSPDDAQMLESRRFGVENLARIFRVPPPVLGDFQGGNYSSISEVGRRGSQPAHALFWPPLAPAE